MQQHRLHGDGCSGATLYAAQQQNIQIFQNRTPQRQLQAGNDCSVEQQQPVESDAIKKAITSCTVTVMTTTQRQVVGDVVTESAAGMPTQSDKQQEMPAAPPTSTEADSESVGRLAAEDNSEVPISKPSADINGSHSKYSYTNVTGALETGSIEQSKDNATKSFTNTVKARTSRMRRMRKVAALKMELTTATTPIPFANASITTATVSLGGKQLNAKNLKHSKNLINSEHLAYDFKANVAKLFANDAAVESAAKNSSNEGFETNIRSSEMLGKIEREVGRSSGSSNNESNGLNNNKQTLNNVGNNNNSNRKNTNNNHIEINYNGNKLNPVEQSLPSSTGIAESAEAAVMAATVEVALSSNFADDTSVQLAAVGAMLHTNERRHIVPEKLQYTKEINIKQGRLMGITRNFHSSTGLRDVDQYLGLPYAEAPVGSRRFMPP
ncbi:PREDICTED: myosin-G heavy chain-like, partial [Rhagoletis zephyria]|uniref:myosin-G heavy chain-like n=1 Tax=Rhagoletis zephyria TaxID=28612 RepID=UPI0008117DD9